jgi:hypothetical protein
MNCQETLEKLEKLRVGYKQMMDTNNGATDESRILYGELEGIINQFTGDQKIEITTNGEAFAIHPNYIAASLLSDRIVYYHEGYSQLLTVIGKVRQYSSDSLATEDSRRSQHMQELITKQKQTNEPKMSAITLSAELPKVKDYSIGVIWKNIEEKFHTRQDRFLEQIKFIKNPYKREVISRDVAHAFKCFESHMYKPAVILGGGVIEEMLRCYLEAKNIKPISDNFDGYIKTCETNGLLKKSIASLSHSFRDFRNWVHIQKEETRKYAISGPTASGAISAIFTVSNDFHDE